MAVRCKKEKIKVLEEMIESKKNESRHMGFKNRVFKDVPTLN